MGDGGTLLGRALFQRLRGLGHAPGADAPPRADAPVGGRRRLPVLSEPLENTGALLPLLPLLSTATAAVHHRCITATAFGGTWRTRPPSPNRMVEPKLAIQGDDRRRIRLKAC